MNDIQGDHLNNDAVLEILTLGQFLVRRGNDIISSENKRSYRIWELCKYFITKRDKATYSETIMEDLWPDRDYSDSKQALRTQIYRLRMLLDRKGLPEEDSFITFSGGAYSLNKNMSYCLDVQEFERLYNGAVHISLKNPDSAIKKYKTAALLYKGDYLPEIAYAEWVIPVRNYYNHVYIQLILDLTALLHDQERNEEIIEVLENAFLIEFFEEEFHFRYLRALIAAGRHRQAQSHYEYTSSVFYREMGIEMSSSMRDLYRNILFQNNSVNRDLHLVQDSLYEAPESDGAFLCTTDVFRYLYNLEVRRNERTGQSVFLGMLTLSWPPSENEDLIGMKNDMHCLEETLLNSLRKGDVVCPWNESQYLILLPEITLENTDLVMRRIKFNYRRFSNNQQVDIQSSVKPVQPGGI